MSTERDLLLGEWACLGLLYEQPGHGFAVAELLRPGGELGRIWSLSRPLTYRSIDVLIERGLLVAVGSEPGSSGPDRTMLRATRQGRAELRTWVRTPVEHLRDLRSSLLLKITIAERCHIGIDEMLDAQRARVADRAAALRAQAFGSDGEVSDPVALWRFEMSDAGLRFLDRIR
jgi:PadR family transcriptional regulator AphA